MSISISDIASPCPTEQSYKGKSYGDMIGKDAKILEGGVVVGTVKHVTGYTEAFEGKEADGFFFPVHLADAYKQKAIRVQRVSGKGGKEKQTEDTDWVLSRSSRYLSAWRPSSRNRAILRKWSARAIASRTTSPTAAMSGSSAAS